MRSWPPILAGLALLIAMTFPVQWLASHPGLSLVAKRVLVFNGLILRRSYPYPAEVENFREALADGLAPSAELFIQALRTPGPVGLSPEFISASDAGGVKLPDVVILVAESFREDAIDPLLMPRLHAVAEHSLWLQNHYANSNASQNGMFALVHARLPLRYFPTVAGVEPALLKTFHDNGYRTHYASCAKPDFIQMERFLSAPPFETSVTTLEPGKRSQWVRGDHLASAELSMHLSSEDPRPAMVMGYYMVTHTPYQSDPAYARFGDQDYADAAQFRDAPEVTQDMRLYRKSLRFLDDLWADLIEKHDDGNTIFVMTGDHGESFGEDGVTIHSSRGSDVQMKTPMIIYDPRRAPEVRTDLTQHSDVLPTVGHLISGRPVSWSGIHGRDLLSKSEESQAILLRPMSTVVPYELDYKFEEPMILVTPRGRLLLGLYLADGVKAVSPSGEIAVRYHGVVDERGAFFRNDLPAETDPSYWADAFAQAIAPVVGTRKTLTPSADTPAEGSAIGIR